MTGGSPVSTDRRSSGTSKHTEDTVIYGNGFFIDIMYNFMTSRLKYCSFAALQTTFMFFLSMHILSSWH